MSLEEFVNTENLRWRDQKRGSIIKKIIKMEEDVVFAISPISYIESFKTSIISDDNLLIELYDTPENIFSRLVFSDENDEIYTDDNYKNANKKNCNAGSTIWYGEHSYIAAVKWEDFIANYNKYFNAAYDRRDNIENYEIVKTIKEQWE